LTGAQFAVGFCCAAVCRKRKCSNVEQAKEKWMANVGYVGELVRSDSMAR
jgi:hypothetical protein